METWSAFSFLAIEFPARIPDVVKKAATYFFGLIALILALLSLYTVFGDSGLAVVLPGGRRIEVQRDFDRTTFERLVGILERA